MCGDSTIVSDAPVSTGAAALPKRGPSCVCRRSGYGQASWQYRHRPGLCDEHELFLPDLDGSVGVDAWINFLGTALAFPPGTGTEVATDCFGTVTSKWDTWDVYSSAGGFADRDWEAVQDDPKYQALWTANLAKDNAISQKASFTFNHDGGSLVCRPGGMTQSGSTQVDISVSLSVSAPPPPPTVTKNDCNARKMVPSSPAQDQSLGQVVPVAGTPFSLRYQSDRTPGYLGNTAAWTANNLALAAGLSTYCMPTIPGRRALPRLRRPAQRNERAAGLHPRRRIPHPQPGQPT